MTCRSLAMRCTQWRSLVGTVIMVTGLSGCIPLVATVLIAEGIKACDLRVPPEQYSRHPPQPLVPPPDGMSMMVFLWPDQRDKDRALPIFQEYEVIGALDGGTYSVHHVQPGPHTFRVNLQLTNEVREDVVLTTQVGKTYFVRFESPDRSLQWMQISEEVALAQLQGLQRIRLESTDGLDWEGPCGSSRHRAHGSEVTADAAQ